MGNFDTSGLTGWASPEAIDTAAGDIKDAGKAIQNTTADAKSTWAGLSGVYQAPEQEIVLTAFNDVGTAGEDVETAAIKVHDALTAFASDIRALVPARKALLDEAATANADSEEPEHVAPGPETLQFRISSLAGQYSAAEDRCATSIMGVHSTFLGGPGVVGTPLVGASSGLAQGVLSRTSHSPILQPTYGSPIRTSAPLRMENLPYDAQFRGTKYAYNSAGLLVPNHIQATTAHPQPVPGRWSNTTLNADPSVARPPAWAKWGGRGLGIAGAGITMWDATSSRWRKDMVEHPEWGTSERVASAGIDAVVVGGMSLAGAAAGAKAGAVLGTMIGGPAGLVVGVAVGALAGWALGAAGKEFGEEIRETFDGAADAVAEGIGDVADKAGEVWDSLWG